MLKNDMPLRSYVFISEKRANKHQEEATNSIIFALKHR